MGIPIFTIPADPPRDSEDLCPDCWGIGKPLGLKPPEFVYAKFEGLIPCDPQIGDCPGPPNGVTFLLRQDPGSPCVYLHWFQNWTVPVWLVLWDASLAELILQAWTPICAGNYFANVKPPCTLTFTNTIACGIGANRCSGGTGIVWW